MDLSSQIIKLKEKVDNYEFYSQFDEIRDTMRPDGSFKYWSKCPFHADTTPSFQMDMRDGRFVCWSKCVEAGDIIDFWMYYYKVSKLKAIIDIAKFAGFKLEFDDNYREELEKKKELASFNLRLMKYFQSCLKESEETKNYLSSRGILKTTIDTFKLGYFSPNKIMDYIQEDEYDVAVKSGVLKRDEDGSVRPFSKVSRLIFPYLQNGYPITFTSRAFIDMTPKYLNFHNNEYVNKKDLIYGLDTALEEIENVKKVIIVEGQFDCMKAWQKGVTNVVAVSGIKMSENQILKLRKHTNEFILCIEDKASFSHIKSSNEEIKKCIPNSKVRILRLYVDDKCDLDDFLSKNPTVKFIDKIIGSKPYNEFVVEESLKSVRIRDVEDKMRFVNRLKDHLLSIRSRGEKNEYIRRISVAIDYPIEEINKDLRNKEIKLQQQMFKGQAVAHDHIIINIQKCLIALMFYEIDVFTIIEKYKENGIDKFLLPEYLAIYNEIASSLDEGQNIEFIKLKLETDMTYKEDFMKCIEKLDIIIIEEDELDDYLLNQKQLIEERRGK